MSKETDKQYEPVKYAVLTNGDSTELERIVGNYLSVGYELAGGVSVATSTSLGGTIYAQAVILRSKE